MRLTSVFAALAALAFAQSAAAVTVAPVSFSPEFETELNEELGVREGDVLRQDVDEAISAALARRGVAVGDGGGTIEVMIVDADPNRPTWQQASDGPSLVFMRSDSSDDARVSSHFNSSRRLWDEATREVRELRARR